MKTVNISLYFLFLTVALFFQSNSGFSNSRSRIGIKTTIYNDTTNSIIKIFPSNPKFINKTVLTFTVANPSKVSIKILDVDGKEIAFLMDKNVPAGTFELLLETKNLKRGMYYCKFLTGERISMKKMIMVK